VNDATRAQHEEVVQKALARNELADPGEVLCALLWLLRERHRAAVSALARRGYREGFELTDPQYGTVAERIRDLAASTADGQDAGGPAVPMRVIADMLEELIQLWNLESLEEAP
jgi:hypothetical protein